MKTYQDGAYAMAALSAAVVAFRLLLKKGLVPRDEAPPPGRPHEIEQRMNDWHDEVRYRRSVITIPVITIPVIWLAFVLSLM